MHFISEAQFPFHDDIIMINYNIKRADSENFFKDMVFITKSGYMFSYDDVMQSDDVGSERCPLKKYLSAIIDASEVYTSCYSIFKGLEFFKKFFIPSEVQIGRYNNKLGFHINLNPGSGYYWV